MPTEQKDPKLFYSHAVIIPSSFSFINVESEPIISESMSRSTPIF